jgi:hypothetical protein
MRPSLTFVAQRGPRLWDPERIFWLPSLDFRVSSGGPALEEVGAMVRSDAKSATLSRGVATLVGGACLVMACSSDTLPRGNAPGTTADISEEEGSARSETPASTPSSSPSGTPKKPSKPKAEEAKVDLLDPALLPKFELTLDSAAIATLSSPEAADDKVWVHGSFRYGDITFDDVGVRAKGSGSFRPYPQKASMKVKFNKFVKGQKLHGLEELTLNNSVDDRNYLRQRLTYHVFRSMDLPAPKANAAQVTINGEDFGLYTSVETPDENFIERTFGKDTIHTLYEAHSPGTWMPGTAYDWEIDIAHPTAPVDTKPDLDRLFDAVASATDATLLADLSPYLDTNKWLRFCATEAMVGMFDHFAYNKYGPHNYFMIGDANGKFVLMPWSTDDSMDHTSPIDASTPSADVVFARCKNSNACWSAYKTEAASVVAKFETLNLSTLARTWHAQIDALAKADPKREISLESYEWYTEELFTWLDERPALIRSQLGL